MTKQQALEEWLLKDFRHTFTEEIANDAIAMLQVGVTMRQKRPVENREIIGTAVASLLWKMIRPGGANNPIDYEKIYGAGSASPPS
jgi:hypothetical protein